MGLLSRSRVDGKAPTSGSRDISDLVVRLGRLEEEVRGLATRLDAMDEHLKRMPNASDFRLIASDIARVEGDMQRIEQKHKEGMLVLYAQVYKELKAIRGERAVEMIVEEPGNGQNGDKADAGAVHPDHLSQLARNWRKMRAQPAPAPE